MSVAHANPSGYGTSSARISFDLAQTWTKSVWCVGPLITQSHGATRPAAGPVEPFRPLATRRNHGVLSADHLPTASGPCGVYAYRSASGYSARGSIARSRHIRRF